MPVIRCYICEAEQGDQKIHDPDGLEDGELCPICYRPACSRHLTIVRWRWRQGGDVDSTRVCRRCNSTYNHRGWDVANRDWIS